MKVPPTSQKSGRRLTRSRKNQPQADIQKQRQIIKNQEPENVCAACLFEISKQAEDYCSTECQHHYHESCLQEWLKQKNTCCLCRQKLKSYTSKSKGQITIPQRSESQTIFDILTLEAFGINNILFPQIIIFGSQRNSFRPSTSLPYNSAQLSNNRPFLTLNSFNNNSWFEQIGIPVLSQRQDTPIRVQNQQMTEWLDAIDLQNISEDQSNNQQQNRRNRNNNRRPVRKPKERKIRKSPRNHTATKGSKKPMKKTSTKNKKKAVKSNVTKNKRISKTRNRMSIDS